MELKLMISEAAGARTAGCSSHAGRQAQSHQRHPEPDQLPPSGSSVLTHRVQCLPSSNRRTARSSCTPCLLNFGISSAHITWLYFEALSSQYRIRLERHGFLSHFNCLRCYRCVISLTRVWLDRLCRPLPASSQMLILRARFLLIMLADVCYSYVSVRCISALFSSVLCT